MCDSPALLLEAWKAVKSELKVLRVKNGFQKLPDPDAPPKFRQILTNVLFESSFPEDGSPARMVGEVQFHLKSFVDVKEKIHAYYDVVRVGANSAFKPDLYTACC